jgi:hypothetical protein
LLYFCIWLAAAVYRRRRAPCVCPNRRSAGRSLVSRGCRRGTIRTIDASLQTDRRRDAAAALCRTCRPRAPRSAFATGRSYGRGPGIVACEHDPSLRPGIVAPMLPAPIEHHPHLRVELETDRRTIDMIKEGVDLVVRIGALRDSSLIAKRLPSIRLLLVASPAYLARRGTPRDLSDLIDHEMVTRELSTRWVFHHDARNAQSSRADGLLFPMQPHRRS